jgi:hypothetical protein
MRLERQRRMLRHVSGEAGGWEHIQALFLKAPELSEGHGVVVSASEDAAAANDGKHSSKVSCLPQPTTTPTYPSLRANTWRPVLSSLEESVPPPAMEAAAPAPTQQAASEAWVHGPNERLRVSGAMRTGATSFAKYLGHYGGGHR